MITDRERLRRILKAAMEEQLEPERWLYLSFADDDGFRGAVIIRAHGVATAMIKAHRLGINPGGQIAAHELFDDVVEANVPEDYRERLLTRAEIEELE